LGPVVGIRRGRDADPRPVAPLGDTPVTIAVFATVVTEISGSTASNVNVAGTI